MDGENGISLCHHVYAGNVADVDELPKALERMVKMLDRNQIERSSVTLVFDKGTAALDNTLLLQQAGVGWISALPWNQAPTGLRERPVEALPLCSSDHPGVHASRNALSFMAPNISASSSTLPRSPARNFIASRPVLPKSCSR